MVIVHYKLDIKTLGTATLLIKKRNNFYMVHLIFFTELMADICLNVEITGNGFKFDTDFKFLKTLLYRVLDFNHQQVIAS